MRPKRVGAVVFCLLLTFSYLVVGNSFGQKDSLVLEAEQRWDTYGCGGTCIYGGHNFAVADVDGDGVKAKAWIAEN